MRADRLTTDWVRRYAQPRRRRRGQRRGRAGRLDRRGRRRRSSPGADRDDAAARAGPTSWPSPAPPDQLDPDALAGVARRRACDLGPELARRSLRRDPRSDADARRDGGRPGGGARPARRTRCCCALVGSPRRPAADAIELPRRRRRAARGSSRDADRRGHGRVVVAATRCRASPSGPSGSSRQHELGRPVRRVRAQRRAAARAARAAALRVDERRPWLAGGSQAVAAKVVVDDPFADPPRDRVDAPALGLVDQARPARSPSRPASAAGSRQAPGRCPAGCGRTGSTTCASSR